MVTAENEPFSVVWAVASLSAIYTKGESEQPTSLCCALWSIIMQHMLCFELNFLTY